MLLGFILGGIVGIGIGYFFYPIINDVLNGIGLFF